MAPKIFNAVADALEWCFRQEGVSFIDQYLHDFIMLGPPNSSACSHDLGIVNRVASEGPIGRGEVWGPKLGLDVRRHGN